MLEEAEINAIFKQQSGRGVSQHMGRHFASYTSFFCKGFEPLAKYLSRPGPLAGAEQGGRVRVSDSGEQRAQTRVDDGNMPLAAPFSSNMQTTVFGVEI